VIPILDWIFEGIVGWIASIVSQLFDAVSGLFLEALGTDMTAMEEYFPFVTKAYDIMQVTAWAILILIVVWQLFRAFGGPITEAENPWHLLIRGAIFAFLIGYAKPIFTACLSIARAPYTSLMDVSMTGEDFTFAGIEQALTSGLTTIVSVASVIGLILILILEIALGWNYFKLLLETVERYIVVGVLCYTSPLAFSVGGSKATNTVFRSWCRMVGSQLLLLVMNVWFLRGFASSMGQFIANGGALTSGKGSIFLWMFCALAYLKCAQRFDSYLASIGLNVAQTGSSMGMELLMAARVLTGAGGAARSAGSVFSRGGSAATGTGAAASGFAAGFASKFSPNSYVRDAVVDGGTRMGFGGGAGFVARAFGGIAARNGATLNGDSIASVAGRSPNASGMIAGDIADRSLSNYMPHMKGFQMQGTQITGGHISTTATTPDGKKANVDMYSASQFEKPDAPHSVVTASDGSQWYQMASGEGRGAFYDAPVFGGMNAQPGADGVNTDPANPAVGETVPGTETPGVQTPADGTPVSESIVPGAEGMPQVVSTFPGDQIHDVPGMSDGIQGEGFVPGGNQMPEAGAEEAVPGMVGQPIEGGQLSVMPSGDPGSITEQIPAAEAEGQAFDAAFTAAPGAETASAELAADPGDIPHPVSTIQGDGTPTDGMEMPQVGVGFMPEFVPNQIPGDSITGAGETPSTSGGEHIISAPAEGGMEVSQTGSGFVPELVGQPDAPAAIGGTDMPGIIPGEQSVPIPPEGGMDAPEFGAAFVGAGSDGNIIAFPGVSSEVPGDSISGSTEDSGEIPHQVPGLVGDDVGRAGVQPEAGVIPGSTEMPVSHDAGHDAPQFGAGVSGGFHGADHSAGSDGDSLHGGDQHTEHPVQGDDSLSYSGGYSHGGYAEAPLVAATFPSAQEGTMLRTVGDGVIEANSPEGGNTLWYNSAYYQEPDAPHSVMEAANGVQWYAMQQQAHAPQFESGENAVLYNQAAFQRFMPGYDGQVTHVDGTHRLDGHFEVRNADGSGTAFYDTARFAAPRGDYQVMEDVRGSQWYAIRGEAAVDRKPVFENGKPVYDDGKLRTVSVETVRYKQTPARFAEPQKRADIDRKPPRRKH